MLVSESVEYDAPDRGTSVGPVIGAPAPDLLLIEQLLDREKRATQRLHIGARPAHCQRGLEFGITGSARDPLPAATCGCQSPTALNGGRILPDAKHATPDLQTEWIEDDARLALEE